MFKVKENPDNDINKYKARLIAKEFHQQQGFNFNKTFSHVVKPTTIGIIFSLFITHKWEIEQIDMNNTFLSGYLQEEVYMK